MKLLKLKTLIFATLTLLSLNSFSEGGTGIGNGGDKYSQQFVFAGKQGLAEMYDQNMIDQQEFSAALTQVDSYIVVSKRRYEKQVIAEVVGNSIVVFRKTFAKLETSLNKKGFAAGFYLKLASVPDVEIKVLNYANFALPTLEMPELSDNMSCRGKYNHWASVAEKRSKIKKLLLFVPMGIGLAATPVLTINATGGILLLTALTAMTSPLPPAGLELLFRDQTKSNLEKAVEVVSWSRSAKKNIPVYLKRLFLKLFKKRYSGKYLDEEIMKYAHSAHKGKETYGLWKLKLEKEVANFPDKKIPKKVVRAMLKERTAKNKEIDSDLLADRNQIINELKQIVDAGVENDEFCQRKIPVKIDLIKRYINDFI